MKLIRISLSTIIIGITTTIVMASTRHDCELATIPRERFAALVGDENGVIDIAAAKVSHRMISSYCITKGRIGGTASDDIDDRAVQSPYILDHLYSVAMRRIACEEEYMYPGLGGNCYEPIGTTGEEREAEIDKLYTELLSPGQVYSRAAPFWDVEMSNSLINTYLRVCPYLAQKYDTLAGSYDVSIDPNSTNGQVLFETDGSFRELFLMRCTESVLGKINDELTVIEIALARHGASFIDNAFRSYGLVSYIDEGFEPFQKKLYEIHEGMAAITQKVQHGIRQCNYT